MWLNLSLFCWNGGVGLVGRGGGLWNIQIKAFNNSSLLSNNIRKFNQMILCTLHQQFSWAWNLDPHFLATSYKIVYNRKQFDTMIQLIYLSIAQWFNTFSLVSWKIDFCIGAIALLFIPLSKWFISDMSPFIFMDIIISLIPFIT